MRFDEWLDRRSRLPEDRPSNGLLIAGLVGFVVLVSAVEYYQLARWDLSYMEDLNNAWRPFAEAVLRDGVAPYTGDAADNKPPVFQYVNLLAGATGHYLPAFFLLITISNSIAAVALFTWVKDREGLFSGWQVGLVGAVLFVAFLPRYYGTAINARSPMLAALLVGLATSRSSFRGAAVMTATLCSQWAVLNVPILAYDGFRSAEHPWRWVTRYVGGALAVAVAAFLPLALIWGPQSAVGGVTVGIFSQHYGIRQQDAANVLVSPGEYLRLLSIMVEYALPLLPFVVVGSIGWIRRSTSGSRYELVVVLLLVNSLPIAVKSLEYYFLHPLPFAAVIAAGGLKLLFETPDPGSSRRTG